MAHLKKESTFTHLRKLNLLIGDFFASQKNIFK